MTPDIPVKERIDFKTFYREVFLPEHSQPANIAAHMFGAILGLAWLIGSVFYWPLYWALLFPVVHAAPGLIGHRFFERNTMVGDMRFTRKDFPNVWFIVGNHLMTVEVLLGRYRPGKKTAQRSS
jgi:hypothetical protein